LECDYEPECPYSAKRFYLKLFEQGRTGWPLSTITSEMTKGGIIHELRTGPYGRCVYECDNDVVDHQVVNMEFEGGETASFTMTGFTKARQRETRIFGSRGEIYANSKKIQIYQFLSGKTEIFDTTIDAPRIPDSLAEHGGGDYTLIDTFVSAVAHNDPSLILSGPEETLETHLMTFAAERSRKEEKVIRL
jgi:predicted dehydrogenase